ncbi:hypothetical protein [Sphingobium sp. BS19]|uniref:hypothetical protein n=1 Tax=Sphingobium sp. BS19 TaxID=3018973 RepID=UPI0022EEFC8A|nr:hypothetical protein [Sphingobium sp. BS19]GLI97111.1 hypothetical protein Sbs19_09290 [Sphingobium sp. BS19]
MGGAPHLSPDDLDLAVGLLKGWSTKLTWDLFLRTLAMELGHGHVYSKVAMLNHEKIKTAWQQAKDRIASEAKEVGERGHGTTVVATLRRMLDEAKADLKAESAKNNELIEQFKRWQYNAERHGMKYSQLDAKLEKPAR